MSIYNSSQAIDRSITNILNWLNINVPVIAYIAVILVGAMIASKVLSRGISRILTRTIREDTFPSKIDRERRIKTLDSIAKAVISFVVWITAVMMILNTIGIDTGPLLASAGIVGVAVGFGAQSLVRDFITGMFIIVENQYRVGDYVQIQNVTGTVKAISMRTTIIQDDDGSIFHIPNGSIIVTGNHSMGNNKLGIELSASTETDVDLLQKVIDKVGIAQTKHIETKDHIVEPLKFRRIMDISGGTVKIRVSGKVKSGKQNLIKNKFYISLQKELVKNKIALK